MNLPLSLEPIDSMSMADTVRTFRKCFPFLENLNKKYKPSGELSDKNFWRSVLSVHQPLGWVQEFTISLEEQYGSGTWENLDGWIADVRMQMDTRLELLSKLIDINAPGAQTAIHGLQAGPIFTQAKRNLGPHWEQSLDKLYSMWGFPMGKNLIPSDKLSPNLRKHAAAILSAWNSLKDRDRGGMTQQFRAKWTSLDLATRKSFLHEVHEYFHELPDVYIYKIASLQESDWGSIGKRAFKAPLLNVDDLLHSDNLPCLLESRLNDHPRNFLPIDGRGVTAGLFCGCLPGLQCDSRLDDGLVNEKTYSFLWSKKGSYNPAAIIYQLEAQSELYRFLQACVENTSLHLNPPEEEGKVRVSPSSLVAQMARIDCAPSNSVDFPLILNLLNCSLNDAIDDLYDLRTDVDLWSTRMSSTSQDRRSATFLRKVLDRMDCFDRLKILVETLPQDGRSGSISGLGENDEDKGCKALEVALQLALEGITSTFSKGHWPRHISNTTLYGLINLIRDQSTILWVVGHGTVLRAIDHELSKGHDRDRLPPDIMRALHDMSVVAYCLRETQKYHLFHQSSQYERSAHLSLELEDDWKRQKGTLRSLADDTLCLMGQDNGKKLDVLFLIKYMNPLEKHQRFWSKIDDFMDKVSLGKSTRPWFEKIQDDAPLELKAPDNTVQTSPLCAPPPDFPSSTQILRSKRRAPMQNNASQSISRIPCKGEAQSKIKITISPTLPDEVYGFWKTLIKGNTKDTFTWSDFLKAMGGVGYKIGSHDGSGYRFEHVKAEKSHAIIFHQPHGYGDQTQPMRNARNWWLSRMQRHVELELVD